MIDIHTDPIPFRFSASDLESMSKFFVDGTIPKLGDQLVLKVYSVEDTEKGGINIYCRWVVVPSETGE